MAETLIELRALQNDVYSRSPRQRSWSAGAGACIAERRQFHAALQAGWL